MFTRVEGPIKECMTLLDVCGSTAELADAKIKYFHLVAAPDELTLLNGIDPHFYAVDEGYWHVHIDNALGKDRRGDSAGIAIGRIAQSYEERAVDDLRRDYLRIVNTYEVPLAAADEGAGRRSDLHQRDHPVRAAAQAAARLQHHVVLRRRV